ncbi:hypothetical protein KM043_000808 [Ampulex compressa]|nr:hypothetical protein KM043_000808 [Ampulex compressa]
MLSAPKRAHRAPLALSKEQPPAGEPGVESSASLIVRGSCADRSSARPLLQATTDEAEARADLISLRASETRATAFLLVQVESYSTLAIAELTLPLQSGELRESREENSVVESSIGFGWPEGSFTRRKAVFPEDEGGLEILPAGYRSRGESTR